MTIEDKIVKSMRDEIEEINPSTFRLFIHFLIKKGEILYDDRLIDHSWFINLIETNRIKFDSFCYHQSYTAIRYKLSGVKYDKKYYRQIDKKLRKKILKRDNHECVYCQSEINLQIDHIIPWSDGGLTKEDNLQVLCQKCNSLKKNN